MWQMSGGLLYDITSISVGNLAVAAALSVRRGWMCDQRDRDRLGQCILIVARSQIVSQTMQYCDNGVLPAR